MSAVDSKAKTRICMRPTNARITRVILLNVLILSFVAWQAARAINDTVINYPGVVFTPGVAVFLLSFVPVLVVVVVLAVGEVSALRNVRHALPESKVFRVVLHPAPRPGPTEGALRDFARQGQRDLYMAMTRDSISLFRGRDLRQISSLSAKDVDIRVEHVLNWLTATAVVLVSAPGYRTVSLALPIVWTGGLVRVSARKLRRMLEQWALSEQQ